MWDRKTQETWASLKSTKFLRPHILRTTCPPQQAKVAPSELKGEGSREPEEWAAYPTRGLEQGPSSTGFTLMAILSFRQPMRKNINQSSFCQPSANKSASILFAINHILSLRFSFMRPLWLTLVTQSSSQAIISGGPFVLIQLYDLKFNWIKLYLHSSKSQQLLAWRTFYCQIKTTILHIMSEKRGTKGVCN